MQARGAARLIRRFTFLVDEGTVGMIPQAEEHLHSRNSRQIPYMKYELPLGFAKLPSAQVHELYEYTRYIRVAGRTLKNKLETWRYGDAHV